MAAWTIRLFRGSAKGIGPERNRVLHASVLIVLLLELIYTAFAVDNPVVPVAMLVGIVSLVFVWRHPMVPLVVNLAVSVLDGPTPLAILAAYFVIVSARPLSARVVLPTAIVFVAHLRPWDPRFIEQGYWAMSLLLAVISTALTLGIGALVFTRAALLQALAELDEAHEEARAVATRAAASAERARISREMHDVVSHQVSLIAVQAGALQVTAAEPRAVEIAKGIRELSVATLTELRYLLAALSSDAAQSPEVVPQPDLSQIPELLQRSGVDADLSMDLDADVNLDPAVQRTVFRILQEGLTNVRKHAPGADVRVRLANTPELLVLSVENGRSATTSPGGVIPGSGRGLIGAHERVELLHGQFLSGPTDSGGFRMTVKIPIVPRPGVEGSRSSV